LNGERLEVRARPEFFADLDRQLPSERGTNGEPSSGDFQVFELLIIVDTFATSFATLPDLIPGRSDYRVMIATGVLVRSYSVVGQLAPDGAVELVALELDLGSDWA
jgi:hypothetical protein